MDLLKCQALIEAVDRGSILAASEKMGYTASGINRMINALEETMGVTLLVRNRNGVFLTESGEALMPQIRQFVKCGEQILQTTSEMNGLVCGELQIGSFYSVAAHYLPRIIKEFNRRYPGVQIQIIENGLDHILSLLKENRIDCCFCITPNDPNLDFIPLFQDPVVAWLPKGHPLSKEDKFPIHKFMDYPYIMMTKEKASITKRIIKRYGLELDVHYSTHDSYTTFRMVEAGLGISMNNELTSIGWTGDVKILPLDPLEEVTIGIAVSKYQKKSVLMKKFLEFIEEGWG